MTHYLGYEKGQAPKGEAGRRRENHRNGTSRKTLVSEDGRLEIEVPRDRAGDFEPQFIGKRQRRFGGFDSKIIAMYAQGMMVREIQAFLEEQYKVKVSADLIRTVTDSVMDDVLEWQSRPLERMYPVVFFDALRVKIRDEGAVKNKAIVCCETWLAVEQVSLTLTLFHRHCDLSITYGKHVVRNI